MRNHFTANVSIVRYAMLYIFVALKENALLQKMLAFKTLEQNQGLILFSHITHASILIFLPKF